MIKKRKPRKLKKKLFKNGVLIYDISCLSKHNTMRDIMEGFHRDGIVLWASAASDNLSEKDCTNPPFVVNNTRSVKIIDVSKQLK